MVYHEQPGEIVGERMNEGEIIVDDIVKTYPGKNGVSILARLPFAAAMYILEAFASRVLLG